MKSRALKLKKRAEESQKKENASAIESQKKEATAAKNLRKVAKCCVFQWFVGREGRKVGSLEQRGRRDVVRGEMKNCKSKCSKHNSRTTLGSWDVAKLHAAVARSAFASQNVSKNCTPWREAHLQEGRMPKNCTPLWAKSVYKSKRAKHLRFGALLEVLMSKRVNAPSCYFNFPVWFSFGLNALW